MYKNIAKPKKSNTDLANDSTRLIFISDEMKIANNWRVANSKDNLRSSGYLILSFLTIKLPTIKKNSRMRNGKANVITNEPAPVPVEKGRRYSEIKKMIYRWRLYIFLSTGRSICKTGGVHELWNCLTHWLVWS